MSDSKIPDREFPGILLGKFPVLIASGNEYPVCGRLDLVTDKEYEDVYHEALHCLGETSSVGFPFQQPDGTRLCEVDGRLLPDDQVIELWWGKDIAEQIRRERGGSGGKFKSQAGPS